MLRRDFLISSGALAATLAAEPGFAKGLTARGDKALLALLQAIFNDQMLHSPEYATNLGLDKGKLAFQRSRLSPNTVAEHNAGRARAQRWLARLNAIPEIGRAHV